MRNAAERKPLPLFVRHVRNIIAHEAASGEIRGDTRRAMPAASAGMRRRKLLSGRLRLFDKGRRRCGLVPARLAWKGLNVSGARAWNMSASSRIRAEENHQVLI